MHGLIDWDYMTPASNYFVKKSCLLPKLGKQNIIQEGDMFQK